MASFQSCGRDWTWKFCVPLPSWLGSWTKNHELNFREGVWTETIWTMNAHVGVNGAFPKLFLWFVFFTHKLSGLQPCRTQTVWPAIFTHKLSGLLPNSRLREWRKISKQHHITQKSDTRPPRPWPPTHPYRRSDQELATPPAQLVRKHPRRQSYCDDMDGSAAMEGWGALAAEGLYFLWFFYT